MTGLLLWKEHLKEIYNKYSYCDPLCGPSAA